MAARKGGKKQRKVGRCARNGQNSRYIAEHRREKNKLKKLMKHIERFPSDHCALGCAGRLRAAVG